MASTILWEVVFAVVTLFSLALATIGGDGRS
jgi:hypothetical protein